jgi:hypothetical protein
MSDEIERRHFFGAAATRVRIRRFSRWGHRRPAKFFADRLAFFLVTGGFGTLRV